MAYISISRNIESKERREKTDGKTNVGGRYEEAESQKERKREQRNIQQIRLRRIDS